MRFYLHLFLKSYTILAILTIINLPLGFAYSLPITSGGLYSLSSSTDCITCSLSTKPNSATGTSTDDNEISTTSSISSTLGQSGSNNYSFDAGYEPCVPPVIAFTASSSSICQGAPVTLTTIANPTETYSYTINGPTGVTLSATNSASAVATGLAVGVNTFTVTASNSLTCSTTATVSVIVIAAPLITLSATQSTICVGQTVDINVLGATVGSTINTSVLGGLGSLLGAVTSFPVSPTVTTTYSVTASPPLLAILGGCPSIAQTTIVVNPLPALQSLNVSLCAAVGTPVDLNAILTANQSSSALLGLTNVFTKLGVGGTIANPTAVSLVAGINNFSVVSTGVGGCTAVTPLNVTLNATPALLPISLSLCAGSTLNLASLTALTGLTNVFRTGDLLGVGAVVGTPASVSIGAGVNLFNVTSTGPNGCTVATPISVTGIALPALLPVSVSLCAAVGTAVNLNTILAANESSSALLGLTNVFAGLGGTLANPTAISLAAGINSFSAVSTGIGSCTTTTPLDVILNTPPALLPVSVSLCVAVGSPVNLNTILTASQSSSALLGLTNVFTGLTGTLANPLAVSLAAGVNSFSVISTGVGGCTATTPVTITVNTGPALLPVSLSLCAAVGTPVNLSAVLTANQSSSALLGLTNVFAGLGGTIANPLAVNLTAGVNIFSVTSTGVNGCTTTTPLTLTVNTPPALLPVSLSLCATVGAPVDLNTILTANQSSSALLGITNVFAGLTGQVANPLSVSLSAGVNSFSIISTGVGGCTATTPLTLTVTPLPTLLPVSLSLCAAVGTAVDLNAILTANQSTSALLGLTNVFAGLGGSIANPLSVSLSAGVNSFSVISTGLGGCIATTPLNITLNTLPVLSPVSLSLCAAVGTLVDLNTVLTANQSSTALLGLTNVFAGLTGQIANPLSVSLSAGINSFSVISTNVSGCTATTPLTINLTLGPGLLPVSLSLCAAVGTPVNLSAVLSANQSSSALLGLTNVFASLTGQIANPLAVSLSAGINSFSVISTGVGGCTATTPLTLTVNTPPTLLPVSLSLCASVGTAVNLNTILTANQNSSALLGLMNVFAGLTGQIANPLAVSLSAGINNFSVVSTSVSGCTATTPITINLTPGPGLLPVSLSLCAAVGTSVDLNTILTANQSSSALLGLTNVFAGLGGTIANPLAVSLNAGLNSFSVVSTGVGGCTVTTPLTINLTPAPVLLPVSLSLCAAVGTPVNLNTILTANQSNTALLGLTNIFVGLGGTLANPTAVSLAAGVNSFSVVSTNISGCTATIPITINLTPGPGLLPVSLSLCAAVGTPVNLSAVLTANQSSAALLGLTNGFVGLTGQIANPLSVSLSAGVNSFSVISTGVGGCTAVNPLTLTLNTPPALLPVSANLCVAVGTPVDLNAILTANQSSSALLGLTNVFAGLTGQITNPLAVSLSAGVNSFSVISTNVSGCTATTPITVNLTSGPALLPVSVSLCAAVGTPVNLSAILTANQSSSALLGLTNVFAGLTGQIANPLAVNLTAGVNSFLVVSTGVGGCTAVTPLTINLTPGPGLLPVNVSLCATVGTPVNLSAILTANQSSTALLGLTNIFANVNGQIANPLAVSLNAGINSFSVISTGVGSCTATTSLNITLNNTPPILLPVSVSLCAAIGAPLNLSAILTANQSSTALLGLTNVFVGVNGAIANPFAVSLSAGINSFSVVSTSAGNCTTSTPLTIVLTPEPKLDIVITAVTCSSATNQYVLSGTVSLTNAQASVLTVTDGVVSTTIAVTNSTPSVFFTLPAQASGASNHTVMASLPGCTTANSPIMRTVTYTSPASCTGGGSSLLTIDKRVSNSVAAIGSVLTYTIVVANVGTAAAANVLVTDSGSAGLRYIANSATSRAGITFVQGNPFSTWTVDALAAGQSVTLTFQAIADSAGILYNKASIPGDTVSVCTSVPYRVCAGESYQFNLTAPTGRSSYHWFRTFNGVTTELTSFTTNVLQVTAAGSYSLAAGNAAISCPGSSCCPFIVEEDSVPTFAARTIPVTCTGATPPTNGQIVLSNLRSGYTYQYSLGATFNATASLSGAARTIPTNGIIATNLANPTTAQAYTIRVYNATGCHTDMTVTLIPTVCGCPADVCVPFVISQNRRPVRIGDPR